MPDTAATTPANAVTCRGVGKVYRTADEQVDALQGIDKDFPAGQVTAIVGPSGSGKSSLLRILSCVDQPDSGTVHIGTTNVAGLRRRARRALRRTAVAYLFQDPNDNLIEYLTATAQVELAARLRGTRPAAAEIENLLHRLRLQHRAGHYPGQLSGGEQQRLAVACAVIGRPSVVVADEPTAELDSRAAGHVLEAFHELCADGASFIVSSHDPHVTAAAHHVLRLDHGRVSESW